MSIIFLSQFLKKAYKFLLWNSSNLKFYLFLTGNHGNVSRVVEISSYSHLKIPETDVPPSRRVPSLGRGGRQGVPPQAGRLWHHVRHCPELLPLVPRGPGLRSDHSGPVCRRALHVFSSHSQVAMLCCLS